MAWDEKKRKQRGPVQKPRYVPTSASQMPTVAVEALRCVMARGAGAQELPNRGPVSSQAGVGHCGRRETRGVVRAVTSMAASSKIEKRPRGETHRFSLLWNGVGARVNPLLMRDAFHTTAYGAVASPAAHGDRVQGRGTTPSVLLAASWLLVFVRWRVAHAAHQRPSQARRREELLLLLLLLLLVLVLLHACAQAGTPAHL